MPFTKCRRCDHFHRTWLDSVTGIEDLGDCNICGCQKPLATLEGETDAGKRPARQRQSD